MTAITSEEERKAKECALRFLTYRQRSCKELSDRLKLKGYKNAVIKVVVQHLKELNLIDDRAFARLWAQARTYRKPIGKKLLSQELWQKGIATEIITEVCESIFAERSEENLALTLAHNRLKSYRNLDSLTCNRRLYSYLRRRGFSIEVISQAIEKLTK
ncbi:hypothetical protein B9J77_04055 [candidate division NPL-UPA2 bacterium Unc8]|uniref:Regulatory protein RecX n=1 Tax=candidate division NPL-UPA2 bacterium Unc8 TaxID=1980939 RepID=A0A399FUB8_UNCN2|nr:Regulatory protein RecX [Bacillota bacterium]RIH99914.1 MAG: hypothetical protein B9J77_04055 [candidate division NPL-UPA2 bacterium Unc8]